ncbi:SRPBCC family protein [Streptomyces sp. P17]|uniref:SRPBCC family protein n=1 Tax=Streptomyces sp. P17 TaxID=3074716 RepID=UPI0028F40869|nr:SRPBCC family protein [Streptomyces sp. P17]MDT9701598.1 SRPBCC family protein [Streptomyces sp. P17]
MAERKAAGRGKARQPQGTDRLKQELENYIEARLQVVLENMGDRLGKGARKLGEAQVGPRALTSAAARQVRGHLPAGQTLTSTASHAKDTAAHAKDVVVDKAKDVGQHGLKREGKSAGDKAPDAAGKGLTIIEDIDVGVPLREAYDQWTQFQEFGRFAKGVVDVQQKDDTTTDWHVKVAKASRRWQGTITEQVPDERIAWTSEGKKATTKGVVTFHPLGENLTKVLLVLRYFPKGPVEKIGSLVRAQGRRARLDLKLYRTFVTMRGEATGGWRGEIHDAEVVRSHEDAEEAEESEESEEYDEEDEPEERYDEDDEPPGDEKDREEEADEDDWDEEDEYEDEDRDGDDGPRTS